MADIDGVEPDPASEASARRVSRRAMIAGTAGAAAAAWAAPVVVTLDSSAFATGPGSAQHCGPIDCGALIDCAHPSSSAFCKCAQRHGGGSVCFDIAYCDVPCTSDNDCDAVGTGFVCADLVPNTCGTCGPATTMCVRPC